MKQHDDDRLPLSFTTRDTSKVFRDATGHLVPPRSDAPLLYGPDGAPRMDERLEAYLTETHERVKRRGDLPAPLALPAAWAKLQAAERRLAAAVEATVVRGQSTRAAALTLPYCFRTVASDKAAGLAQLQIWTRLPSDEITRQLRTLTSLHAA